MRESELADLLISMAADRGTDIDAAAEELASIALPSFVDARLFRAAIIQTVEQHLRAEVEERLQSIRRRFDAEPQKPHFAPPRPTVAPPVSAPITPPAMNIDAAPRYEEAGAMPDVTIADIAQQATPADNAAAEDELPTDATMVWTTRHG